MGDIVFEGKQYRKEDFVYYPSEEPWKRMMYCAAFWELWKGERGMGFKWRGKRFRIWMEFRRHFNELYRERKRERKPIVWDDFKNWYDPLGGE